MRDFADTERAKRNKKQTKEIHRYGRCYIAREKGGIQTVAEDEVCHLSQYGDTNKAEGSVGPASWLDRGIGQPLWQDAYQELNFTVYGEAEEHKSVTNISVSVV